MEHRPTDIPVVAAFLLAATVIAAAVGTALLFPGRLLDWLSSFNPRGMAAFESLGKVSGLLLWGLGAGTASAAVGLLHRKKWAWWFAVALFAINGCGDLVSFLVTGDWLRTASGVAISLAFLCSLGRPRVRGYFKPAA